MSNLSYLNSFSHNSFRSTYVFVDEKGMMHAIATDAFDYQLKHHCVPLNIHIDQAKSYDVTNNTFYVIFKDNNKTFYKEFVLSKYTNHINLIIKSNLYEIKHVETERLNLLNEKSF